MYIACEKGHLKIVRWLYAHGATDVTRPNINGTTSIGKACQEGHLNIVKYLIHHHRMSPDTLEGWYKKLSYSSECELRQTARKNHLEYHVFITLATIIRYIKIDPYQVMDETTGHLVIPRNSILIFRHEHGRILLRMVADYLCGGEEARHIWGLILLKTEF